MSKKAPNLEQLFLNNNKIKNASILKKRIFEHLRIIKLEGNEISQKEIENINSGLESNTFEFVYKINKEEFSYENKIRIFGDIFVRNNKKNCKIKINNEEKELIEYYNYKEDEEKLIVFLKVTGNITDMSSMFSNCSSLKEVTKISNWDTSNVEYMNSMFYGCNNLEEVDEISKWDISNVKSMNYMFCNCTSLTNLNIDNWDMTNKEFEDMFGGCNTIIYPKFYINKLEEGKEEEEEKNKLKNS